MKRSLLVVSMLGLLPTLPGCIAWEIRDEIRTTNQHLCGVNPALVHTLNSRTLTIRKGDVIRVHARP